MCRTVACIAFCLNCPRDFVPALLGQLLVLYLPWLVVLNNSMRLEDNLYRFILNFATALPFLQVCSYEALESADSLAEAALTA